ncbi:MAG: hypothetical protein Q8Q94_03290 [bacterium]|nr:hypothetical protein [bacterium]MDZ4299975.1 hypothetical protein [Candidatus Sungbacteria bacterium]
MDEGTLPFDATMDALQALIESRFSLAASSLKVYPVTVYYGLSLADMIEAGHYDWVNGSITAEHFPIVGEGMVDLNINLLHFKRFIQSDEAIKEMDEMGLRPLTLPELLAFGAKFPDMQREFPIIAFGTVWQDRDGFRGVPALGEYDRGCNLGLVWFGYRWSGTYRFAAVRK